MATLVCTINKEANTSSQDYFDNTVAVDVKGPFEAFYHLDYISPIYWLKDQFRDLSERLTDCQFKKLIEGTMAKILEITISEEETENSMQNITENIEYTNSSSDYIRSKYSLDIYS